MMSPGSERVENRLRHQAFRFLLKPFPCPPKTSNHRNFRCHHNAQNLWVKSSNKVISSRDMFEQDGGPQGSNRRVYLCFCCATGSRTSTSVGRLGKSTLPALESAATSYPCFRLSKNQRNQLSNEKVSSQGRRSRRAVTLYLHNLPANRSQQRLAHRAMSKQHMSIGVDSFRCPVDPAPWPSC